MLTPKTDISLIAIYYSILNTEALLASPKNS